MNHIKFLLVMLCIISLTSFAQAQDASDASSWTFLGSISGDPVPATGVYFSPDGRTLIIAGMNLMVNLQDGTQRTFEGTLSMGSQYAISPDGKWLVAASQDVYIWGIEAGVLEPLLHPQVISLDPAVVARGEQIFRSSQCSGCHMDAIGTGPTLTEIAQNADQRVPELSAAEYLYQSIVDPRAYVVEGYLGGAHPSGYGDWYSEEELQALVAYLLSLRVE